MSSPKRPGKSIFSGRRRPVTRKSGYSTHPDTTGGEFRIEDVETISLASGQSLTISFELPNAPEGAFVGFGGWFFAPASCTASVNLSTQTRCIVTPPASPDWSKFGSLWQSTGRPERATFTLTATEDCRVATWGILGGVCAHELLEGGREALLKNMYLFAPEALFVVQTATMQTELSAVAQSETTVEKLETVPIYLKSCNRCARYLPINITNERNHLSFTNHCSAPTRTPCTHSTFSNLRNVVPGQQPERLRLTNGYQLECRFCKKFTVNAAHNPLRTSAQMKEDAARRRAFELLLMELYRGSPQLRYRHETGSELTNDVYERFGHRCFNCGATLNTANEMHLDHTRPLALLWPLDGTATSLCASCNSTKRDRPPSEFYTTQQLEDLATITGIPVEELRDPSPNVGAIQLLRGRLDWFFNEFLARPELVGEQDGKVPAELLVKALQKALERMPGGAPFDLQAIYDSRVEDGPGSSVDEN